MFEHIAHISAQARKKDVIPFEFNDFPDFMEILFCLVREFGSLATSSFKRCVIIGPQVSLITRIMGLLLLFKLKVKIWLLPKTRKSKISSLIQY